MKDVAWLGHSVSKELVALRQLLAFAFAFVVLCSRGPGAEEALRGRAAVFSDAGGIRDHEVHAEYSSFVEEFGVKQMASPPWRVVALMIQRSLEDFAHAVNAHAVALYSGHVITWVLVEADAACGRLWYVGCWFRHDSYATASVEAP